MDFVQKLMSIQYDEFLEFIVRLADLSNFNVIEEPMKVDKKVEEKKEKTKNENAEDEENEEIEDLDLDPIGD